MSKHEDRVAYMILLHTDVIYKCIYILDVISNVNIQIDPFATLVPKLPKSKIYLHILDITSRIHIHIWRPPGRLNGGGLGGRMPPHESKTSKIRLLRKNVYTSRFWTPNPKSCNIHIYHFHISEWFTLDFCQ